MDQAYIDTLNRLHGCQLLLAREVKRICDSHQIRYFMIAGTLLGAVRHKGFIPWDDDMDIGMLREDYTRFIEIAKQELDDRFFLQDPDTDPAYGLPFAKLLLKDTVMVEQNSCDNQAQKSIYIDIFPLDCVPEDPKQQKQHNRRTYFLRRLLLAKQRYRVYRPGETVKKLVYLALRFLSLFASRQRICRSLDEEIQRYNGQETEQIVNIGGAYGYNKETLRRQWFDQSTELDFENITLSAPAAYTDYLEYFYGDYMTPPPEDKRFNRHSIVSLDFGPYSEKEEESQ